MPQNQQAGSTAADAARTVTWSMTPGVLTVESTGGPDGGARKQVYKKSELKPCKRNAAPQAIASVSQVPAPASYAS
jgi:hypothetical protein